MGKGLNRFCRVWLYIIYAVLFIPIFIVVLMSFNQSEYGTFPIKFTLDWYILLFTESDLLSATWLSIWFSFVVALAAVVIGVMASFGMRGMSKKALNMFSTLLNVPIIIPWLVLSTALLILFNAVGIGRSYCGMFLGNLTVVIPYVVLIVFGRMSGTDTMPEEAARTLGASSLRILWDITLPEAFPAILSGGLMSFMVCFNNFVVQYYLAPFGVRTLPLEIYNMVRVGYKPDMNALASVIMLFSVILVVMVTKLGFKAGNISGIRNNRKKTAN